ncbi:BORG1 protein, partial [Urocolius indicus]|nr:BORG1 protein [Urocolius indicus]
MSTKVPIYLKRSSRKGKKEKLRDVLSSDMISPPLGDFRHTIHVGSGGRGDTFGDVSFLQGNFHLLPRTGSSSETEPGDPQLLPWDLCRSSTVSSSLQEASEASSPLLKNTVSLPLLPQPRAPPKPPRLHLQEPHSGAGGTEEEEEEEEGEGRAAVPAPQPLVSPANGLDEPPLLSHAGSLLSLHLDLGPSILEDVLQVMEKHQGTGETWR